VAPPVVAPPVEWPPVAAPPVVAPAAIPPKVPFPATPPCPETPLAPPVAEATPAEPATSSGKSSDPLLQAKLTPATPRMNICTERARISRFLLRTRHSGNGRRLPNPSRPQPLRDDPLKIGNLPFVASSCRESAAWARRAHRARSVASAVSGAPARGRIKRDFEGRR